MSEPKKSSPTEMGLPLQHISGFISVEEAFCGLRSFIFSKAMAK
jgi:hypothetical protein